MSEEDSVARIEQDISDDAVQSESVLCEDPVDTETISEPQESQMTEDELRRLYDEEEIEV